MSPKSCAISHLEEELIISGKLQLDYCSGGLRYAEVIKQLDSGEWSHLFKELRATLKER